MQNQGQRLEEIFRKNKNKGIAIAITGSWGIGKTFFWKNFIESKICKEKEERKNYYYRATLNDNKAVFDKKYAYVSLFGVESLSDLKTQIYTQLSGHHFSAKDQPKFEVPRWMKTIASGLKDEKFSQWGFSASMQFFDAMLFTQIKDAIICFDDFERMSDKLDIKDVMGLANQLKLEKNCQVILILDETKAEGENQNKYADYKEKLIDETVKITSVEPLICSKAEEVKIDNELINLMVKFANDLKIHNFRFFQKVIKLYIKFRKELPEQVAYSTKKIILIRVLQGYLIEDYGNTFDVSWQDLEMSQVVARRGRESSDEKGIFKNLEKIDFRLGTASDEWAREFQKYFNQKEQVDFSLLAELANSDLISDQNNKIKDNFHELLESFWDLRVDESFSTRLYEITKQVIGLENLSNISFAIKLIEITQPNSKVQVKELENLTLEWIQTQFIGNQRVFDRAERWGELRTIFKEFIQKFELPSEYLPILIDAVFNRYIQGLLNDKDKKCLEKATKQQWKELLFSEIPYDDRFANVNSSYIVKKILTKSDNAEFIASFRKNVTEIYEEKGKESEFYKNYMNYLISRLDN